jgi:hypothetical protein
MSVTSSPLITTPRPRRRRWLFYAFLAAVVIAGLLGGYYFYASWSLENQTALAVAETATRDPRWRLDEIEADRKGYAPEDNSALHVNKVVGLIGNAGPSNHRDHQLAFEGLQPQHQLTAQQMEIIRDSFAQMDQGLAEARKLKDMPGGRHPITWSPDFISTMLPTQQNSRRVTDVLQHDAMLRAQNGEPDKALESCMALLNGARSVGDEPMLISFLIRVAGDGMTAAQVERILAQGFPKPVTLEEMQRRLGQERDELRDHWRHAIRGERAGHHSLFQTIAAGKIKVSRLTGMTGRPGPLDQLLDQFPLVITRDYPNHLRFMNEMVAAAELPLEQQLDTFQKLEDRVKKSTSTFTRLLTPAAGRVGEAHLRIQAQLAAAEVALACERFRIEHKRWPESLEELVKDKKLDAIATDPMDGKALRFRRLADGAVIYSVGHDKQDNHGVINRERSHEPGSDWGARVWDPVRRRQPPRPPGIDPAPVVAPP